MAREERASTVSKLSRFRRSNDYYSDESDEGRYRRRIRVDGDDEYYDEEEV